MRRRIVKYIGIGTMAAVLCVFTQMHTPVVSHALERAGSLRLTNYAPLYLDPPEEENSGGSGAEDNADGGTTVIDPNRQSNETQGGTGSAQGASGNADAGNGATQGQPGNAGSSSGTGSSAAGTGASENNTETSGSGSSQDENAAAGGATSGADSAASGTTDSSSGAASSYVTTPINPNPYTANVNTKDMPATGVEDLRRGVVSVILILFGIIAILISIPTLKGKRRSDR